MGYGDFSFHETTKDGHALGVAYLITREQFEHVAAQETSGRFPEEVESFGWFENIIDLGEMESFEVKTITNRTLRPFNEPCSTYWDTLWGIRQNWQDMSDEEIKEYLDECIR